LLPLSAPSEHVRVSEIVLQACPTAGFAAEYAATLAPLAIVPPQGKVQAAGVQDCWLKLPLSVPLVHVRVCAIALHTWPTGAVAAE
jgi:hypothetical protein